MGDGAEKVPALLPGGEGPPFFAGARCSILPRAHKRLRICPRTEFWLSLHNVLMVTPSASPAPADTPAPVDLHVLLQAAVAQSFNAVVITNADLSGRGPLIEYCNPAFCELTGYTAAELLGQSPRILQGPRTDRAVLAQLRRCLETGEFFRGATVNYRKDGVPYHVEWNISPVRDEAGRICHFVSVQQNISARVQAERDRALLAQALNAAHEPIFITDCQAVIVFVNRAFESLTGYSADEVLGRTPKLLRSGAHDQSFYRALNASLQSGESFRITITNRRKNGELYHAEQSIAPLHGEDGQISHFVSISKDISGMVLRERALREMAHRDKLTGLLNRRAGEAELKRCQSEALAEGRKYALILGDVDHFKQINDRFGHPQGDRVLEAVAGVLRDKVRSSDAVIRWGGEEFLIIVQGASLLGGSELAERIRSAVAACADPEVGAFTMSLGVGEWRPGESEIELLERTDHALYLAKRGGRNRVACAG